MRAARNIIRLATTFVALIGSVRAEVQSIEFDAKIAKIEISRHFDAKTIVTGVDPRFLVRLTLLEDANGVGKAGDSVKIAIHSPARDLQITDIGKASGKAVRLTLSQFKETNLRRLRRAKPKDAHPPKAP